MPIYKHYCKVESSHDESGTSSTTKSRKSKKKAVEATDYDRDAEADRDLIEVGQFLFRVFA